jgi:hypothetical protein
MTNSIQSSQNTDETRTESATSFAEVQASDRTDIDSAVANLVAKKRRTRQDREDLDHEAEVRDLLHLAQEVFAVDADAVGPILDRLHDLVSRDEGLDDVLSRRSDRLERGADIDTETARQVRSRFRRQQRQRRRGRTPPNAEEEYRTLLHLSRALGYYSSVTDMTPYAPIRLENLHGSTEDVTPIGRRRLKRNTTLTREQAAISIPHKSCDHILAVALPRSGKDSTLTSIGCNLHREHGYKYISIYDDGRAETPMLAIPNDDDGIHKSLERLNQGPKALDTEVFIPNTPEVPEKLPANFTPFTIGIESLTPHLILRLAGVTASDPTVEDRIERALEETLDGSGGIPELTAHLTRLSKSQNTTIEWTERRDKHAGNSVQTYTAHVEMNASKALEKAANRLGTLASYGIVAGRGATTNIDMEEVVRDDDRAAVLFCNFMDDSKEGLKYILTDLWLRLIYRARDRNPRLPRVCVEIRELKDLAPSKPGDVRHKDAIKAVRQTIFFLVSNGGSRRVMLLGSAQKLNDVYKSVRTKMATKILLRLDEEQIGTLEKSYNFSWNQKQQLEGFGVGQGMLIAGGDKVWPIEWRGAPCGLGLGDEMWLDRYGKARGCRVVTDKEPWPPADAANSEWWVHVDEIDDDPKHAIRPIDERPSVGVPYTEWALLETDFPAGTDPDDVDRRLVEEVLAERRDYPLATDLRMVKTGSDTSHREMTISVGTDKETFITEAGSLCRKHGLPPQLKSLVVTESGNLRAEGRRRKCLEALAIIHSNDVRRHKDIVECASTINSLSAISKPLAGFLSPAVQKNGKQYELTEVGKQAITNVDWDELMSAVKSLYNEGLDGDDDFYKKGRDSREEESTEADA